MKKRFIVLALALMVLGACEANTSGNIDVSTTDIKYFKDTRTGLCFALTASRASWSVSSTGLGVAAVHCSPEVLALIR